MSRRLRWLGLLAAWSALVVFGWLSWQVFDSGGAPEAYEGPWTVGPPAQALNDAAEQHLAAGLESLRDPERPIVERISAYEQELRAAETLLAQSLRTRPPQAQVLARLAATRWELGRTGGDIDPAPHLAMINVAASMAPAVPRVQFELGKLLLQMNQADEAGSVFARTLELDPSRSADVVGVFRQRLLSADDILERLPHLPEVLIAVAPQFHAEDRADDYRQLLERSLDPDRADLLEVFGEACRASAQSERLVEALTDMAPRRDPEAEIQRLRQLSLGYLELSRPEDALDTARQARTIRPGSGHLAEHLGDVTHRTGDAGAAREAYGEALALWARERGKPLRRARVYRKIGRTHETDGRADLAYDAFQRALELNENERYARRRVAEIEAAAGVGGRSAGDGG